MGYAVYNLRGGNYGRKFGEMEFEEAAQMVEEGLECMRELAEEMKEQYGERRGSYGSRGGYGMRGDYGRRDWDDDDMMNERRMRDSRGRFR
jgi:hypothetical protein